MIVTQTSKTDDVTKALPHATGPEKSVLSSILQEPARFIRLARNETIEPEDFYLPAHRLLYGFLLELNENQIDIELVSLVQRLLDRGLLNRVGGPGAVMELHNYAVNHAHFANHLQQVKEKAVLREIIAISSEQIRAAYEQPDEVKELISLLGDNMERVRKKTENRASDFKRYREQIVSPEEIEEETRNGFDGSIANDGDACFLPGFPLGFRKHEFSVWLGVSNHGKSQALQNQLAHLAAQGRKSFIASFEQKPSMTLGQILKCMTAYKDLHRSEEWPKAYKYITSLVTMYKSTERTCPKQLVETMRQAYLNDGTDTFACDNLMCLNADRGDNSAIAAAMDMLRCFFSDYPVHGHLVVHPRKVADENVGKPANQNTIAGPAEIGNMPQSVIVVHRNMTKTEQLEEMKANHFKPDEITNFWNSTPCGKIIVRKQRATGAMPMRDVWFHQEVNQFALVPGKPMPMFSGQPPWES